MTPQELEGWVLLASNVNEKQWEATSRLHQWLNTANDAAPMLMALLELSSNDQVTFYALTTLARIDLTPKERVTLRNLLLHWPPSSPPFVQSKVGVVLSLLIRRDFSQSWPTAFGDLLQQAAPTIWLRTLDELFQDLDHLDTDTTSTTSTTITHMKDTIRGLTTCAAVAVQDTIAAHIVDALTTQPLTAPHLRPLALQVAKRIVSWIDMGLVINPVVGWLYACLASPDTSGPAMECLQEIMGRGMEASKKVEFMLTTKILEHVHAHVRLDAMDASPIDTVMEVSKLVNMTGLELLPLWEEGFDVLALLKQVMELFVLCFAFDDIDVSGAVIPLASRLTVTMGSNTNNNPFRIFLPQLLAVQYRQMKYPSDFTFDPENDDEAEEEMYRTELRKLNQRMVKVAPDMCLQFLCEALANLPVPISTSPMADVEAALRLVYHYCEGIRPPPGLNVVMKNDTFRSILLALHGSDIILHPHPEVLTLYYDLAVRYYPIFKDQPDLLPRILGAMSGASGLQHSNPRVRSRSCYLLLKLVKSLVSELRPYVETAVTGIQGLLSNQSQYPLRPEDAVYLFETIGLLLGKTGLSPAEQQQSLTKVMTPHIRSIESMLRSSDLARDPEYFGSVLSTSLSAIAYLSKGFSKPPPEVQLVLVETLNITVAVLEGLPTNEQIRRNSVILFQRMIQCIGFKVLESAPRFLEIFIVNCTSGDVVDVAQMFHQLCIKFKQDAVPAIDRALLPFLQKCHSLMPVTGEVVTSEIPPHLLTEQLSIKKLTFAVLQHIVTYRATAVLLSPTNSPSFEIILRTMSEGAITVEDAIMKKTCIQFFHELLDQWGQQMNGSTNGNFSIQQGFAQYIFTTFVPGMINCILDPTFDETDAVMSRCVVEFAGVLWSFKSTRGLDLFQQAIVVGCLQPIRCPSNVLTGFQTASSKMEMEVCMKEMLKVMKPSTKS